ncbi:MAG TPA: helix-turn-helix domain-containing protein [Candidatus Acidoferrum sp.]|nr:helix-turn-helix domain-containing protein [Candidatus Acidoferrum sp.]
MAIVSTCPVETTMSMIGGKWKMYIIGLLAEAPMRFGELRGGVPGISAKVLTSQLNELIADRLVSKKVYPEIPPHTEYALTAVGETLLPIIVAMRIWGTEFARSMTGGNLEAFSDGHVSKWGKICFMDCKVCPFDGDCSAYRDKIRAVL